ncbi:MAG: SLBB domain-containing protein [Rhodothermales bacterium]|nr:SLBB domain-containing protein [Rhodothermales bacterium]MDG2016284.1 SLBB domain-containing protein [Rhodothermales bacterium]
MSTFHMFNTIFSQTHRVLAIVISLTALFLFPGTASAQIAGQNGLSSDRSQSNPLLLLQQKMAEGVMSASAIPLEGTVDETVYIVGPGDHFSISVSGQAIPSPAVVGLDGRIVLPDAGAVIIGGLTLGEARVVMMEAMSTSFGEASVDIALAQSRQFYVHVSGAVPTPGRYMALPVARVSSVLEFAFADTSSFAVANPQFRPSLRNIELRHVDGTTSAVDLVKYYSAGNSDANPFLRDGDVIHVPALNTKYSSITIGGHIPYPGAYDFKNGDTLADLIQLAGGIQLDGSVRSVRVVRMGDDGPDSFLFTAEIASTSDFALQATDAVSVAEQVDKRATVKIEGHLDYPGEYPIIDGKTTLKEIVQMAGGASEGALLRGAFLERRALPDPSDNSALDRFESPYALMEMMAQADTLAILQQLRLTDMDFLSRSYFAQEMRLQNRVSVDIEAALGDGDAVVLQADDRIVIPKDLNTVYVFGQVNNPGYLTFEPGHTAAYFAAKAGGVNEHAETTFVVNPATGTYSIDTTVPVQSGDVIFVDRTGGIASSPEMARLIMEQDRIRADQRIRVIQAVVQSIGTLATVLTLIISIRRN